MKAKYVFRIVVFCITCVLFILPLFWLPPGTMDLGGDSNRLYFWQPLVFLRHTSFYNVVVGGKGYVEPNFYYIPYVLFLSCIRLFTSPTVAIGIINGAKLSVGFLAVYGIVWQLITAKTKKVSPLNYRECVKTTTVMSWMKQLQSRAKRAQNASKTPAVMPWDYYMSAILSGLFYVAAFGSKNMVFFWDQAITSHNQLFVNPLMAYLFLMILVKRRALYLYIAILVSFVFSVNFAITSAPPFFAFYPMVVVFMLFYVHHIRKLEIDGKKLFLGLSLFLGVQSFHLLPQFMALFEPGSYANMRVFDKEQILFEGLRYFFGLKEQGKVVLNILFPIHGMSLLAWIIPVVVFLGAIASKKRKKTVALLGTFALVTLFLTSANVTQLGYNMYVRLFYLPGFSMFRNYHTQWLYVHIFFFSLLFGVSLSELFARMRPKYRKALSCLLAVVVIALSAYVVTGEPVKHAFIRGSSVEQPVLTMDPVYERTLAYIRTLPHDGKILVLPLTDFYHQVIPDSQGNGVYVGPSTLQHLSDTYSFVGYQNLTPYIEDMMQYAREENYDEIVNILSVLNIKYILYNSDPRAYDNQYLTWPYEYMKTAFPDNQKDYGVFVSRLATSTLYAQGPYRVLEVDPAVSNDTIFIPDSLSIQAEMPRIEKRGSYHGVFIDKKTCDSMMDNMFCTKYVGSDATLETRFVSPIEYEISIHNLDITQPFFLVMQHSFHRDWRLFYKGQELQNAHHIMVNGYANGWVLDRSDMSNTNDIVLTIRLVTQRYFYIGVVLSVLSVFTTLALLLFGLKRKRI